MYLIDSINHCKDLEEDILGIAILEPVTAVYIAQNVHREWIYYPFNLLVLDAITKLLSDFKRIDFNTVTFEIEQKTNSKTYNGDKISYLLAKLTQRVVSGAHISEWCEMMRVMHHNRQIEGISSISGSNVPSDEKRAKIESILSSGNLVKINTNWVKMGNALEDYLTYYQNNYGNQVIGYKTGLHKLDWLIGGFRPETFWVIAARPSIGKSAFGQQIISNVAASGYRVGVVSIEMGNNELIARMLAYTSGIDFEDIYRMKVPPDAIQRETTKLSSYNLMFSDKTKCSIEGIFASATKLQNTYPLDLLVIDYLQLMSSEAKVQNKNDEITKISAGLKELSRTLKIPVIALAQINRAGADEPKLENLRDGGSIEQDADGVIFIHGDRELEDRKITIAKNRNGKLGHVQTKFIGSQMKFIEIDSAGNTNIPTF